MKLADIADVIRSKNAGSYYYTIDIMFESPERFELVKEADILNREVFADLYDLPVSDVQFFEYDPGLAFKVTIPRPKPNGSPGENDLLGCQQHVPIYTIELDVDEADIPD